MTTQTTTKRSFTDEFKREAVSLLASSGRPLTQMAIELGIQRWPGKSAQCDKWNFCLNAAMIAAEQERL